VELELENPVLDADPWAETLLARYTTEAVETYALYNKNSLTVRKI
jgi:hypothetical protein